VSANAYGLSPLRRTNLSIKRKTPSHNAESPFSKKSSFLKTEGSPLLKRSTENVYSNTLKL
jgi:hypothetical protein